jgi:L-fucose mutarotase
MLKIKLAHPEILNALGKAGHGSKVLIADGDYPVSTTGGKNTAVVHLNLSAGVVSCTQVLEALLPVLLIENAEVMDVPANRPEAPIWHEYREIMKSNGYEIPLTKVERFSFYNLVSQDTTALIIQTGELRDYANILLTVGSL